MHTFNAQTERKVIQNSFINAKKSISLSNEPKIQSENYLILFHKYVFFWLHIEVSSQIKTEYFWLDLFFFSLPSPVTLNSDDGFFYFLFIFSMQN